MGSDPEFLRNITDAASHYAEATRIPCSVLSISDHSLPDSPCTFCRFLSAEQQEACSTLHLNSAGQAERFGGSCIYFCRCSLLFWTSPVISDGVMTHALTAGPVLSLDIDDIREDLSVLGDRFDELIHTVARADIRQVNSLSEVLRMCAAWASGYQEQQMVAGRSVLNQQARLSEYIHELKIREQDNQFAPVPSYPLDKEQMLQQAIRFGDRERAQELMNELLGIIFFSSGSRLDHIKYRVLELVVLLSRSALEGGASESEIMEISYRCQREINQLTSLEAIAHWLSGILRQYTSLVFDTRKHAYGDMMLRALHFINHRYTEKLSLQEVADYVGFSPTYFSKLFNEEMKCTFSTYVNRLRTEQAKVLLKNTRYTLVEISGIVGFDDQSYFSRVFKAIVGITPGEYRRRSGGFPSSRQEIHS